MHKLHLLAPCLVLLLTAACDKGDKGDKKEKDDTAGAQDDTGDDTGAIDNDGDGYPAGEDCNDDDASIHPGAKEVCDGVDQDCDGKNDNGVITTWFQDVDGDGYGDTASATSACEAPGKDWVDRGGDCEPKNPKVSVNTWYKDDDGDGYGNPEVLVEACDMPKNCADNDDDCNDNEASIHPGAEDIADNGIDEDCDGEDGSVDINTDGVTYAACPSAFPADAVGGAITLEGETADVSDLVYTVSYEGASTFSVLDVYLVRFQGGGTGLSFDTTLAITCEEDGAHLVYEERHDTGSARAAGESTAVFSDRPLFFANEYEYADEWTLEGLSYSADPFDPMFEDSGDDFTVGVRNEVDVDIGSSTYTAIRMIFTDRTGATGTFYFVEDYGLVYQKVSGVADISATAVSGL